VKELLKKSGNAFYLGGAAASVAASMPFVAKYKDVFASLPWHELTRYVAAPWTVIGVGELGQVLRDNERDRAEGVELHALEKVGRAIRPANLLAYPIAFATGENALYTLVATGATTVAGHVLEAVGKSLRTK